MGKIRVLVVDDSVVIRRVVTEELGNDPDIEVVGTASNGQIAISRLTQVCPDLITLDVEMPEMDVWLPGAIRRAIPDCQSSCSALTERGEATSMPRTGASDYLRSPLRLAMEESRLDRAELIPAIKALCRTSSRWLCRPAAPALI